MAIPYLRPCPQAGCPGLREPDVCPVCGYGRAWKDSQRNRNARSGWEQQRRRKRILRRDQDICHVCRKPGADSVDHVVAIAQGGADNDANLAAIHQEPCHREKTARESKARRP